MKRITIIALALLIGVSCSKDKSNDNFDSVTFSSAPITRAADDQWTIGDRVGIYVGEGSSTSYQYEVQSTDGSLMSPLKSINSVQKPEDDQSEVTYFAYYPYKSTITTPTYSVNVADQSDLPSIDLMWAKSTDSDLDVTFGFKHQLVKLVIDLKTTSGSLSNIGATLCEANSTAMFDLNSGVFSDFATGSIALNVTKVDSENATITAIVPPMADLSGVYINFLVGSNYEECKFDQFDNKEWKAGEVYEYEISLSGNN